MSTISLKYNYTIATAGTTAVSAPVVTILPAVGTAISIPANAFTVLNGTNDYYFTVRLASPLPANKNFKIQVDLNIPSSDKAVQANSITTNARLSSPASTLPVKLLSYADNIVNNKVHLKWSVAENETGEYFIVEKSADGKQFSNASVVFASGNTGTESYVYNESDELTSDTYYRLKIANKNKSISYSSIVVLKSTKATATNSISVLQNPVHSALTFNYTAAGENEVNIYTTAGVKVYSTKASMQQGINSISLDVNRV
ncbi:MAG: hypothetical protein ICV79_12825, partial [Flavisolibacter sp.]|nr:hypothetical protein [Flavisolibacter sp.]